MRMRLAAAQQLRHFYGLKSGVEATQRRGGPRQERLAICVRLEALAGKASLLCRGVHQDASTVSRLEKRKLTVLLISNDSFDRHETGKSEPELFVLRVETKVATYLGDQRGVA